MGGIGGAVARGYREAQAQEEKRRRRGAYRGPYEVRYEGGRRVEDWSRLGEERERRPSLVGRLLKTRLGRSMAAYYGEQTAGQKVYLAWSLGGPYWATLLRVRGSPEFLAKMPKDIRIIDLPGKGRQVHPLDIPKFTKWMVPALLAEVEKHPKLGEQLREKEPALRRFVNDCSTDPRMFIGLGPELKLAKVVGRPVVAAIGRTALYRRVAAACGPKLARVFLSPKTRVAQLGDAELAEAVAKLQDRLGMEAQAGAWARGEVGRVLRPAGAVTGKVGPLRVLLRRYSNTEISEAVVLLDKAEDIAEYSRLVKAGKLERASSNRVLELFGKLRKELTRPAFAKIRAPAPATGGAAVWRPVRGAMPGAEEAAARARVERLGGIAAARKVPLKKGEYRLLDELKPRRTREGKLFRWEDPATGQPVTPYRRRYMTRPRKAAPLAKEVVPGEVRAPGMRLPRQVEGPPVVRSPVEVERALGAIVRGEPRYQALCGEPGTRALLARAMGRAEGLKDPKQMAAALGILDDMMKQHDRTTVNAVLSFLDTWGVVRVKQVYTLYNPAWYLKNFLDSVVVKNLLAGVPLAKLRRFSRELPLDVFDRPVEWGGVTWTKEITGLKPGRLSSFFMRGGNWIENTARRALGDHAYWGEISRLRKVGGVSKERMQTLASQAARKAVAQVHFDYGALAKADEVLRRVFPFWMYQKNQLRWMVEQAAMRPRLMVGGFHFMEAGERGGGPGVALGKVPVGRRLPGMERLEVQAAVLASPERYLKSLCALIGEDEGERERWRKAGGLGKLFRGSEALGFRAHVVLEQGLSALLKGGDLMEDRNWQQVAPLVQAVGKMLGQDVTFIGVWRTMFPTETSQPRQAVLEKGLERRALMRQAFSVLDGEEWSAAECRRYARREMQVAGVGAFFGLYPKVREPKYPEMQRLLKQRWEVPFEEKAAFDRAHPEVRMFLDSLAIKQR